MRSDRLMVMAALDCWREIAARWPEVELIEAQLMPDHFHGVLFVKERLPKNKSLGSIIWGFKVGCTKAWRALSAEYGRGPNSREPNRLAPSPIGDGSPTWAEGFVDTILFGPGQLKKMIAYLRDNPRRLGVKREKPWLFKVTRELEIDRIGRLKRVTRLLRYAIRAFRRSISRAVSSSSLARPGIY